MRIDRVQTFILKAPLGEGRFYSSQGSFPERVSLLVRITTDSGVSGWGESGVSMPVEHVAAYIHDVAAPRLLGRDPLQTEPVWHDLYATSRDFGRKGTPIDALSGIDVALWDIRGKDAEQPIHALMGGAFRDRVRPYATGLYYGGDDVRNVADQVARVHDGAQEYTSRGFTAIKGKIGLLPIRDDIKRMAAAREAVGEAIGANMDPSHMMAMGGEPLTAIPRLAGAIHHVHAKDSRIDPANAGPNTLIEVKADNRVTERAWSYVTLGYGHGEAWWREFVFLLRAAGYDDVLSIEHEDHLINRLEGVRKSVDLLEKVILREPSSYGTPDIV